MSGGFAMLTPASIAKHPIHPMLITIPIGFWVFSFVCDLVRYFGGSSPNWAIVALYHRTAGGFRLAWRKDGSRPWRGRAEPSGDSALNRGTRWQQSLHLAPDWRALGG
jgi:hypothetical protein